MFKKFGRYTLLLCAVALIATTGATAGSLITGANVKNSSLTGKDVKNKSLTTKDFRGSVRGPAGAAGAQGAQGASGAQGATGATGIASIVSARRDGIGVATAYCPSGTRPISGGGVENGSGYLWASGASKDDNGVGWTVAGNASSAVIAFAYCSAGVSQFTFPDGTSRSGAGLLNPDKLRAQVARR